MPGRASRHGEESYAAQRIAHRGGRRARAHPADARQPGVRCLRPGVCLNGLVDRYLAALVAHDLGRLLLTAHVGFTENGQELRLGDGLWGTASGPGKYKLYVADPEDGQAGFYGTVMENDTPVLMALRLKVTYGLI